MSQEDTPTLAPTSNGFSNSESIPTSNHDVWPNQRPVADSKPQPDHPANPYASPTPFDKSDAASVAGLTPTTVDVGFIFTRAWEVFMQHFGLLLGVGAVIGLLEIISDFVLNTAVGMDNQGVILGGLTTIVISLIQIYLSVGQTRISLKLVRGQHANFSELFNGGDKFWATVGYTLLIMLPVMIGFLLLIVPGVFLVLYFWASYTLIVDNRCSVLDSFGIAAKIGERNLLASFILFVTSAGILILGGMFCYVGLFFATSFVSVLWATAYLMMTGQTRSH